MKKFGKMFGVVALAVATITAGAVGLSGCGGNKVRMSEVETLVSSETTINQMASGYKLDLSINGVKTTGQVVFKDEGKMEFAIVADATGVQGAEDAYSEMYLKGDYLYMRESKTDKFRKTFVDLSDQTNDASDMIATYTQMSDMTNTIKQYIDIFKTVEGKGLKLTKVENDGVVEYNMSYTEATGKTTFTLAYKDNQIQKVYVSANAQISGQPLNIVMSYELYNGEVVFPADLDSNVEELPEGGEEGGEIIEGEALAEVV